MGNCCSGDHSKPEERSEPPIEADDQEYGPGDHPRTSNTSDPATNTPFLVTPDTMALESEMEKNFPLQKKLAGDHQATTSSTSSPSKEDGKKAFLFNPRLVSLLEFFSHLYVRKKDLFTRVISLHEEELLKVLKKVEQVEESIEMPSIQPIQRSRSLRTEEELKNERMKVKTFEPDKGQPPGGPGQGGNGSGGKKPGGGSK